MSTPSSPKRSKFLLTIIGVAVAFIAFILTLIITQVVQFDFSLLTAGGGGRAAVCGNGVLEKPEQCDDGNKRSGDGCSKNCKIEFINPNPDPSSSSSSSSVPASSSSSSSSAVSSSVSNSTPSSSSSSSQPFVSCATSSSSSSSSSVPAVRYTVDPNFVITNGRFPAEALRPQTYGYNEVAFTSADYTSVVFVPLEPARFIGTGNTRLLLTVETLNGATFKGFIFPGSIQVRNSDNNIFEYNKHYAETAQPYRIRYGSDGNKIRYSYFERVNIPTTADVVAIYLSDGPNLNNEIGPDNDILNYTDGVQIGFRLNTDYGYGAGTCIHHNRIGVTSKFHNPDGSMVPGLENALDFKSGGTPENPVSVEFNDMFGYRPAILNGAGTPGYAITFHQVASDIKFFGNTVRDSEAGLFLNAQYTPTGQWFTPRVHFESNTFTDIKNHGFASPWPTKQGSLVCGTNSATFKNNTCLHCDRLEEMPPNPAAGPRTGLYETTIWTQ